MRPDRPRCSTEARRREDALFATASRRRNWILLEQPGAWGRDALLESSLPLDVAEALHEMANALRIRIVLLRRGPLSPELNVYLAHTGSSRTAPYLEHATVHEPADLLEADLTPLLSGRPVGIGEPEERPLYLVCTNGRHDVCCAERGRPLFRALLSEYPDRTWECSHIGGDRFAGNLVCYPHGLYYGWVEPDRGLRIARSYEQGHMDLELYRGRSSYPVLIQAAEHFIRRQVGLTRVDDLVPEDSRTVADDTVEVTFRGPDGRSYVSRLRIGQREEPVFLTCQAEGPARPRQFDLLSVRRG